MYISEPVAISFYHFIPFIWLMISPFIFLAFSKNYYRKNPTLEIYSNYFVEGTLCPKCKIGKITFSVLFDEHGFEFFTSGCTSRIKELFVCLDCKTVYPETNLVMYFGRLFLRRRRNM